MGHFQCESPILEKEANYVDSKESEEELVLMEEAKQEEVQDETWFLDSGCSNHMTGNKEWFTKRCCKHAIRLVTLDEAFKHVVRLGNDSRISVQGKGNIKLKMRGLTQLITNVYFVPKLQTILSFGQLQEKDLSVVIQKGACNIYHSSKGLIMKTEMTSNRMFALQAAPIIQKCLQTTTQTITDLWHKRYGHLSTSGLKLLQSK